MYMTYSLSVKDGSVRTNVLRKTMSSREHVILDILI